MIKPKFVGRFGSEPKSDRPKGPNQQEGAQQPEQEKQEPEQEEQKQQQPSTEEEKPKAEEPKGEAPKEQPKENEPKQEAPKQQESQIDDAKLLEVLNKKSGKEYKTLEEYWASQNKEEPKKTEKPKNKEVQMLEKFLEQNPEKTSQDFFALKKDWKSVSDIDVLRQKQRSEYGPELSDEDADILIKRQLGIDLDEDLKELDKADSVTLMSNASKYKKELTSKQEEMLKTLEVEDTPETKESRPDSETITLIDGTEISKDDYAKAREKYLSENKRIATETKEHSFKFQFSNGGSQETIEIPYILTDSDREEILSATETVSDPAVLKRYSTKDGDFDIAAYQRAKLFELKGDKIVEALISNAFSQGVEREVKEERNINFKPGTSKAPKDGEKKSKIDTSRIPGKNRSFGPRFNLTKN